jgi:hypothetical protein
MSAQAEQLNEAVQALQAMVYGQQTSRQGFEAQPASQRSAPRGEGSSAPVANTGQEFRQQQEKQAPAEF